MGYNVVKQRRVFMSAFQLQAFVPADGTLSITLPEHFRETDVRLYVSKEEMDESPQMNEERLALDHPLGKTVLADFVPMSDEEYIAWMNSFRGSLQNVDYSDIRDETDREL
jgi:hypothetical protein